MRAHSLCRKKKKICHSPDPKLTKNFFLPDSLKASYGLFLYMSNIWTSLKKREFMWMYFPKWTIKQKFFSSCHLDINTVATGPWETISLINSLYSDAIYQFLTEWIKQCVVKQQFFRRENYRISTCWLLWFAFSGRILEFLLCLHSYHCI